MASQGPNNPGTTSDDNSVGAFPWASPNNAQVADGTYASVNMSVGCFPAGTMITLANGSKPIEQIQVGDMVRTLYTDDGSDSIRAYPIIATKKRKDITLIRFTLSNGYSVQSTPLHPFFEATQRIFMGAEEFAVGDSMGTFNKRGKVDCHKIVRIERIDFAEPIDVYETTVDEDHTYFVNGIAVHNY